MVHLIVPNQGRQGLLCHREQFRALSVNSSTGLHDEVGIIISAHVQK